MTIESERASEPAWQLTAALRHFGWEPAGGMAGRYELWRPDPATHRRYREGAGHELSIDNWAELEALVPIDPERRDYSILVDKARRALVEVIGGEAERFFETLAQTSRAALDTTRFKKSTPLDNGLISWEQGEALFEAARQSLIAAAKAAKAPRRYHGHASSYLARQFIESAMMGQTEIGSFIVTAYSPANKHFHATQADAERGAGYDESIVGVSGRDIVKQLEASLSAVRDAVTEFRRTPNVELFAETVQDGVSYELMHGLGLLSEDSSESSVEISFYGTTTAARTVHFEFAATDVPILNQAASYLAVTRPPERATLRGFVTLLERPKSGQAGIVRLDVTSDSEIKKVRVRLTSEEYDAALEAHGNDAELQVSGNLQKEGRYYWLYDAENLEVHGSSGDEQVGFDFE